MVRRHAHYIVAAAMILLMVPAVFAQTVRKGIFVSAEQLDTAGILMNPPAQNSDETKAELAELHRLQETRSPAQVLRAQNDDSEEDIFIFRNILGDRFNREALPMTALLSDHVRNDEGIIVNPAKAFFQRPRPYHFDETIKPVCKIKEDPKDYAYPSGQATTGYLEGLVLTLLVPEKRDAILARADDYAHNRLICGAHYPSDIVASKQVAYAAIGIIVNNPQFKRELAATSAEIRAALGLQAGQPPKAPMAEDVFKNVQVLKGIPVDEFMDTMGMFAASLSFNCVDCHTLQSVGSWDKFADDTPLKQTTRKMMLMVNALNKDNFSGVRSVTCYTCHRGDLRPKMVPDLAAQYAAYTENANEPTLLPASSGPSVDQIFNKYLQAVGGAQRVSALTSFTGKGTFIGFETEQTKVQVDVFARAPNQRAIVVHTVLGDSTRIFDGRAAWIASPDRPVGLLSLTGGNLEGARIDGAVAFPAQLKGAFNQWRVGATSIDDKEVQVLQGSNPRQPPVNFYFDQSGLLIRVVRYADTAVGRVPTQIDYSDYRDVAGVKMPFKWITTWTDGQATTELSEIQANTAIPASRFAQPAPIRPKLGN